MNVRKEVKDMLASGAHEGDVMESLIEAMESTEAYLVRLHKLSGCETGISIDTKITALKTKLAAAQKRCAELESLALSSKNEQAARDRFNIKCHTDQVNNLETERDRLRSLAKGLRDALDDAASYVKQLAGHDNSCDPGCDEELAEWKVIIARAAKEGL